MFRPEWLYVWSPISGCFITLAKQCVVEIWNKRFCCRESQDNSSGSSVMWLCLTGRVCFSSTAVHVPDNRRCLSRRLDLLPYQSTPTVFMLSMFQVHICLILCLLCLLQLPITVKWADAERAEEWPGSSGRLQDSNVQVRRRLLRQRLPPLQRPDLPQHRGAVSACEWTL